MTEASGKNNNEPTFVNRHQVKKSFYLFSTFALGVGSAVLLDALLKSKFGVDTTGSIVATIDSVDDFLSGYFPPVLARLSAFSVPLALIVCWFWYRRAKAFRAKVRSNFEEELAETSLAKVELYRRLSRRADTFQRWEDIQVIKWSYCKWFPTAFERPETNEKTGARENMPTGPAVKYLKKLFKDAEKEVEFIPYGSGPRDKAVPWSELGKHLDRQACHIIATPIYEVNKRMDEMLFCSPLYHADIGCYMSEHYFQKVAKKHHVDDKPLSWEELVELLCKKLIPTCSKVTCIPGELHAFICDRHLAISDKLKFVDVEDKGIVDLVADLADDGNDEAPFIFAERLSIIEHIKGMSPTDRPELRNVLAKENYILPASFAIPYGSHTFRRYVNHLISKTQDGSPLQDDIDDTMESLQQTISEEEMPCFAKL